MDRYGRAIYWLETAPGEPAPPLISDERADVAIIGAGYTGLWTAHELLSADPTLSIVVLEAEEIGFGASGRNGGFAMTLLDMSLAHLLRNHGAEAARSAHEAVARSVDAIGEVCRRHAIDCDYHKGGLMVVATNPAQRGRIEADLEAASELGLPGFRPLDAAQAQELVHSPTYLGGYLEDACATIHPARLVRGLARVVAGMGARVWGSSPVVDIGDAANGPVTLRTPKGTVTADQVVVATNAWASQLAPFARLVVPLYTYVLLTEPLTPEQRLAVGWEGRQGVEDKRNYVHYYRITADGRILWGGSDGVIYRGLRLGAACDGNDAVFRGLEQTFRHTFPQLHAVSFSHRWGGPVGISVPFLPLFGTLPGGRIHYGLAYNGHGVAPSHTGGCILADLITGRKRGYTDLVFVTGKQPRFPPRPLTWLGAALSRRSLRRQDRRMDAGRAVGDMDPWLLRIMK